MPNKITCLVFSISLIPRCFSVLHIHNDSGSSDTYTLVHYFVLLHCPMHICCLVPTAIDAAHTKQQLSPRAYNACANNTNNRCMQTISKKEIKLVRIFSAHWQMTGVFIYIYKTPPQKIWQVSLEYRDIYRG